MLVPLRAAPGSDEIQVVLTRRRDDLRHHAGEISFPGGRREAADNSLSDTALREAEEEIGLARARARMLGALSPVPTIATNYVIHPFVAEIAAGPNWQPSAREVDAVLELSLGALARASTRTWIERRGIRFETDAYVLGEDLIWGATARILRELLERAPASGPDGRLSLT